MVVWLLGNKLDFRFKNKIAIVIFIKKGSLKTPPYWGFGEPQNVRLVFFMWPGDCDYRKVEIKPATSGLGCIRSVG